jgi:hypothetical protein
MRTVSTHTSTSPSRSLPRLNNCARCTCTTPGPPFSGIHMFQLCFGRSGLPCMRVCVQCVCVRVDARVCTVCSIHADLYWTERFVAAAAATTATSTNTPTPKRCRHYLHQTLRPRPYYGSHRHRHPHPTHASIIQAEYSPAIPGRLAVGTTDGTVAIVDIDSPCPPRCGSHFCRCPSVCFCRIGR